MLCCRLSRRVQVQFRRRYLLGLRGSIEGSPMLKSRVAAIISSTLTTVVTSAVIVTTCKYVYNLVHN